MFTTEEQQYLAQFQCLLCGQTLDKQKCGCEYAKPCDLLKRQQECLQKLRDQRRE